MLVGVCDFPGSYAFPPAGYGGIERWLWAVAEGARAAGADAHLLGPLWREDLAPKWTRRPLRLEDLEPGSLTARELQAASYDLLIVGHEYPTLPTWRRIRELLDCDVATFQHHPGFQHAADAFDGVRTRLYCYSPEMVERYTVQQPIPELAVHRGLDEDEPPSVPGRDLVWLGRIDEDKAPHIAVRAAQILGRRIRIVGPVFSDTYARKHARILAADHVEWAGELGGREKSAAFGNAGVFVYTYARGYVEAGAAVFGESLPAGTPVAALTWREGTCAHAALCDRSGVVTVVDPAVDDEAAARALATAIRQAEELDHAEVQAIGRHRFDPRRHFEALAERPC
ncbi:glycosyltransferase [Streptomyces sp. NPDC096193]|uniref:glycosyltransferase n=1 Tax=Streptomyces sp. NPDC096193 TaxID=3155821 RepID=UPI00332AE84F